MSSSDDGERGCMTIIVFIVFFLGIGRYLDQIEYVVVAVFNAIQYVLQLKWLLFVGGGAVVVLLLIALYGYILEIRQDAEEYQQRLEQQRSGRNFAGEEQLAAQRESAHQQQLEREKRRLRSEQRRKEAARREREEREWFENEVAMIAEADESIEHLKAMSGAEFEDFMADFLGLQGYEVEKLSGSGDQGVDLLLNDNGKRVAVQLKRHARPLGNKPIQEVHTGRFVHKANDAWVITTSSFTKGGIEAARKTFVRLIDGDELYAWIKDANEESAS